MKIKVLLPIVCMALLFVAPQAQAQSKRAERKLKREMRKLEKQVQKVKELKQDSYFPLIKEMELKRAHELENLDELKSLKWEMQGKHREMALKEAEKARELAHVYQIKNRDQLLKQREQMKEYQFKAQDELRRALEKQRFELEKIREHYPDGFHIDELEIPEINVDIPEFEFDMPRQIYKFKKSEGGALGAEGGFVYNFESDNNLSVKTDLENESIDKTYEYTVSDDASYLTLKANGSLSEGNMEIEIKTPADKEYQNIELSPAADVDWSQKIKLSDEKKESYVGKWTIRVKGDDVKGHFGLSLRSR